MRSIIAAGFALALSLVFVGFVMGLGFAMGFWLTTQPPQAPEGLSALEQIAPLPTLTELDLRSCEPVVVEIQEPTPWPTLAVSQTPEPTRNPTQAAELEARTRYLRLHKGEVVEFGMTCFSTNTAVEHSIELQDISPSAAVFRCIGTFAVGERVETESGCPNDPVGFPGLEVGRIIAIEEDPAGLGQVVVIDVHDRTAFVDTP